ncbi:MAG: radical SAM family heme chaperone HemW [Bacteroidetes bacterium]|nr:radical SAM family heme chaperone HemW [Bacteroidota bacterium]
MAGIYLHIPFCKSKCAYCDFYSVATVKNKEQFVTAICKEIELRKDYLFPDSVQTIYFGGGTPSMLDLQEIDKILNALNKNFTIEEQNEITLEANPDDLKESYLKGLKSLGINRLSIGVQSFIPDDLLLMRRSHTAEQALKSVQTAQDQGFENISVDLIYGLPNLSMQSWKQNIEKVIALNIQHISAYHLTIEPKTLFFKYYQNGKINLPSENESLDQFKKLKELTAKNGFVHYEISNFAKDGSISFHNTNYWMDVKYLGLGPSAHSYNLTSREWNISDIRAYMDGIFQGKLVKETENLSKNEKYNDFVITSLRTMWGLNTEKLKKKFGEKYLSDFIKKSKKYIDQNLMKQDRQNYFLSEKGIFISDHIMQNFLIV